MSKTNSTLEINFFNAIKNNQPAQVKTLANQMPSVLQAFDYQSFGGTALTICCSNENREMIDLLLDLGVDPNTKSDWWAGGWNPIQTALSQGNIALAQYFSTKGAKIEIHEAAGLGLTSKLEVMLAAKPTSVHQRGGDGCTPLHFAASIEVVDLLLSYGANINARDVDHYSTATQYLAAHKPHVVKHLFSHGAEADIFSIIMIGDEHRFDDMITADPSLLQLKINQQTFPPGPDHDVHNILTFVVGSECNALHTAAIAKQLRMIEKIVKAGLDINSTGGYDESTALHMVAWRDDILVAKKLVELGADIDKRSGAMHNNTPAGWAIIGGSPDVFCHLIDQGATIQDYFEGDIERGLNGALMRYKKVPISNFERMKDKLNSLRS